MTKKFSATETPPPPIKKLEKFLQQIAPCIVIKRSEYYQVQVIKELVPILNENTKR